MIAKLGAVVAALLIATPVAAQALVFDMDATLVCLEGSTERGGASDCIGLSADACMEASAGGSSTLGMGACLTQEMAYWDDRLNNAYRTLRASDEADDTAAKGDAGYVSKSEALREMQRDWIAYRNSTCEYERAQWGGGTGAGPATTACLMRMTGEQSLYLQATAAEN